MNLRSRSLKRIRCIACAFFYFLFVASAFAGNPIPTVVAPVVPQAVVPGHAAFTLKVHGANFVPGAVVNWNGKARSTTFISARELQAQILASDVGKATAGYITVTNPPPGGGVSSSSYAIVEVHLPTKTIVAGQPNFYLGGSVPWTLITADFNHDGILDFASYLGGEEIQLMLGNGDGTFRPGSIAAKDAYTSAPEDGMAYGDFNNDGNLDLAFANRPNGPPFGIKVNFGKGNGKFKFGPGFGLKYGPELLAGDFNQDGSLDLATAGQESLSVFLNQGDGTFKQGIIRFPEPDEDIVTADFNGDGKLDLAFERLSAKGWAIFIALGNGDGTFQEPRQITGSRAICESPPLVVNDFNNDGKADLAYCERDQRNGKIWVMLGNGDGTFKKPVSYPIPSGINGFTFAAGDFNSDGNTDLVASYVISDTQSQFAVLLGNGDGTFQRQKLVSLAGEPYEGIGIVTGDFNSDGLLDFFLQLPGNLAVFVQK